MTNPRTGRINQEWEVESITSKAYALNATSGASGVFASQHKTVVSEAYLLGGYGVDHGTVAAVPGTQIATVVAHDVSFPNAGTIGATQVATLGPQQFWVGGLPGTITTGLFLIRGR
jgi:hypothetical protein